MHIVMTVNAAWNIVNFRKPVVQALLQAGHEITVLAPPDDAVTQLAEMGCRFAPLEMNAKGLNPIEGLAFQRDMRRQFRALKPDVILSYTIKNNIFGARAARALGIPFLPNVTGLGTAFLSGKLLQLVTEHLYRRAFAHLPVVFFQNDDDKSLFVDRGMIRAEQAQLLPGSGIDLQHFAPTPMPADHTAPVFLMIARLLRDKGVYEFVEAARAVRARHPSARFQLLGAVGAENRTAIGMGQVEAWLREGVIEYLGTTRDVRPAIATAHCLVLPSYREGAPRTLIEGAAMGRPGITTDVPGCRAVVDAGQSGLLCQPRDSASLAQAIVTFLEMDAGQKCAMGHAGRQKMEREFDEKIVVDAYMRAIARIAPALGKIN